MKNKEEQKELRQTTTLNKYKLPITCFQFEAERLSGRRFSTPLMGIQIMKRPWARHVFCLRTHLTARNSLHESHLW